MVRDFENNIKTIDGFRKLGKKYIHNRKVKNIEASVKEVTAETVKALLEAIEGKEKNTTQIVKPRLLPIWSGQLFDRWMSEVGKWYINSKYSEEDEYLDLMESLKKNETIKEYMNRILINGRKR